MKIIDPHVHLFDVINGDYHWLNANNPPFWPDKYKINQAFDDTNLTLAKNDVIAGFVHIEAGYDNNMPWREIEWLERTVTKPFRSIASVDLTVSQTAFKVLIDKLVTFKSVVGVRHILDDHAVELLQLPNVLANLTLLAAYNLIFETQINNDKQAVNCFANMANEIPTLTMILSHSLFCPKDELSRLHWQAHLAVLSRHTNVFIKASGWEMVSRDYSMSDLEFAVSAMVKQLGSARVLLASNFPLCLFSQSYNALWQQYAALPVPQSLLNLLVYRNAQVVYGF